MPGVAETDPDLELLFRVGQGEASAAREMVSRKLPRLLSLAQRMLGDRGEAEDVAQEAFVRIWKQAPKWQSGQAKFDTWLHRVALNLCHDRLRGRREQPVEEVPDVADPALIPEEQMGAQQQSDRVAKALARLPGRQREALVLQYYQELAVDDVASLMGCSVEAVESLLSRGRKALRAMLMEPGKQGQSQEQS